MHAVLLFTLALSAPPAADVVLAKYDAMMGPSHFKAVMTMTAHRDDGSTRTYKMTLLKGANDKSRISFHEPASARGQEILRQGDNAWIYMPNLKRALRLANRDSFQGGDFNNGDVLRTQYGDDYTAVVQEDAKHPELWLLELKAKGEGAAYDAIKLWVQRAPLGLPVRGEYYTQSGKLLRSAEFLEVRDFGGLRRPARVKMRNEIATARYSELVYEALDVSVNAPAQRFVLDDLGR